MAELEAGGEGPCRECPLSTPPPPQEEGAAVVAAPSLAPGDD